MADIKISALTATTGANGTDVLPLVQSGTTYQITRDNLLTNLTDPTTAQQPATKHYVDASIAAISNQGAGFTGVISGCGVVWTGLLNFTVSAGTYAINGTSYSIAQTDLTLSAADPANPRFDVIAVNTSSAAVIIVGTPAASPLIPTVTDPATQLYLTAISIPANATTPGNITNTVLYAENAGSPTEWNTSSSGTTWALASTNNPHLGTKCIEATSLTNAGYAQLQKGTGTFDLSTVNNLVFYIRSKATWGANRSLTIEFLNAGTVVGNALTFREGSFGFVSSNTTSYQQIVIPVSAFNIGNTVVNQLRFIAAGSGGSAIGFYLDDVSLQAGVSVTSQSFLVWRATWSSSTAYVKNDVVSSGSLVWVALLPNTNSQPTITNTNWQSLNGVAATGTAGSNIVLATSPTITTPFISSLGNSSSAFSVNTNLLTNVVDPVSAQDASTKNYVDTHLGGTGLPCVTKQVAGTDFTTTSSTFVDVTGLTFAGAAGHHYEVEFVGTTTSSTASGLSGTIAYTGAGSGGGFIQMGNLLGTSAQYSGNDIGAAPGLAVNTNTHQCILWLKGTIRTANSGNITIQVKGSGNTVTVYIGSRMTVTTLG